jgi:hypothetical protein
LAFSFWPTAFAAPELDLGWRQDSEISCPCFGNAAYSALRSVTGGGLLEVDPRLELGENLPPVEIRQR